MSKFKSAAESVIKGVKAAAAKQRESPTYAMNSTEFLNVFRGGEYRKRNAYEETTYFICLKMLSETLGKMPIKTYIRTSEGSEEIEDYEISKLLKIRPNPFMTPSIFWSTVEMNRNHYGNGYVYIRKQFIRKRYGGEFKVIDLWIMQSEYVQVLCDNEGYFGNKGRIWYVYSDPVSGERYLFDTSEVMHFKTSHSFNGIIGKPVQEILRDTINGAGAAQDFQNRIYENGLTAKAVLEYSGDISKEAKEALRKTFEDFGNGASNVGRIMPVPMGMKLVPLDIKMTDAQFFELKKYTALQIAAAFGVKPNQINDYEKSSYSNSEMQQLSFLVDTELFILKQYEEEMDFKMLTEVKRNKGEYCKFNEKVVLRADSKTQMETLSEGVKGSIYKPNEARRTLDLKNEPGGDKLIANGNVIPLIDAGAQYTKTEKARGGDTDEDEE